MRYLDGEKLPLASSASDDMLLFTSALSILIGLILAYIGKKGQQMWMHVWGIGLVIASILMGVVTWQNMV